MKDSPLTRSRRHFIACKTGGRWREVVAVEMYLSFLRTKSRDTNSLQFYSSMEGREGACLWRPDELVGLRSIFCGKRWRKRRRDTELWMHKVFRTIDDVTKAVEVLFSVCDKSMIQHTDIRRLRSFRRSQFLGFECRWAFAGEDKQ